MNNFELLKITNMHSGHLCLELTECISWDLFPSVAEATTQVIGAKILEKIDGPDIRIWKIEFGGAMLRLVFDDYPVMMTIESPDDLGDKQLRLIHDMLKYS